MSSFQEKKKRDIQSFKQISLVSSLFMNLKENKKKMCFNWILNLISVSASSSNLLSFTKVYDKF